MKSSQRKILLLGLLYLFSSLFVATALWTYNPADPSFNSIGNRQYAVNACGLFGSFFSDALLQMFGITAWGFVALLMGLSIQAFRKKETGLSWDRSVAGLFLILTIASLISLHLNTKTIYQGNVFLSGFFGKFLHTQLTRLFNTTGVTLILWTSFAALAVILFGHHLADRRITVQFKWSILLVPFQKFWTMLRMIGKKITSKRQAYPQSYPQSTRATHKKTAQNMTIAPAGATAAADDNEEEYIEEEITQEIEVAFAEDEVARGVVPTKRRKVDLKKKVQRKIANWKLPEIGMLEDPPETRYRVDEKEIKMKSNLLVDKLSQFSVNGEVRGAKPGPAVTLFEFKPNADVKISKITELADDLSLALSAESVRIIAPIPGRDVVGIETSNTHRETVYLKDILAMDDFWSDDMKLPMALGRQADGMPKVVDLRKMPHLLVAGTTGSGKSVFVVCALTGLLFRHSPQTLRLIMIDPKQVDLAAFNNVPHLLLPMVSDPKKAVGALNWAVREMEKRYRSMSKFGARGLESFNEKVAALTKEQIAEHEHVNESMDPAINQGSYYFTHQPYIVIVVEEFGDLMAVDKNNVETAVVRLAQMARACGIHLILAMQSPRKDVVTGLIKTNIPGRISFKVASKMDSRIILDDSGAERLLARGDMLFQAPGTPKPERHHGPWVTEEEISAIMNYWSAQGQPEYDEVAMRAITKPVFSAEGGGGDEWGNGEDSDNDERYDEILAWASGLKTVSASLIQRKFRLGYPRAARLIELFEREGVVGPPNGSKPRDVLVRSYDGEKPA